MGVVNKLKELHKQTLLKLSDIKRAVIAEDSGVDLEGYLGRARTLKSYLDGGSEEEAVAPTLSGSVGSPAYAGDLFSITINMTAGSYSGVSCQMRITISPYTGCYLQYYDDTQTSYVDISGSAGVFTYGGESGFELQDMSVSMRAKAETAGTYTVKVELVTVDGGDVLVSKEKEVEVSESEGEDEEE